MTSLQGFDPSSIYEGSHHDQVKGGKIQRSKESEEVLSSRLRRKIQRYVCYWRRQSGDAWPLYPKTQDNISDSPSAAERLCDEMLFRGLRTLDWFIAFVYCHAPVGFLQSYRSFKNRRYRNADTVETGAIAKEARQQAGS
jgi:hypothetical protein